MHFRRLQALLPRQALPRLRALLHLQVSRRLRGLPLHRALLRRLASHRLQVLSRLQVWAPLQTLLPLQVPVRLQASRLLGQLLLEPQGFLLILQLHP